MWDTGGARGKENRNGAATPTCTRLFFDFSFAFNTIIPSRMETKLLNLGVNQHTCRWMKDFLFNWPQTISLRIYHSSFLTFNTGVPQGCVLSPLLSSLYTDDCTPNHSTNAQSLWTTQLWLVWYAKVMSLPTGTRLADWQSGVPLTNWHSKRK